MSNTDSYDLLALGSGEAGKFLAWTFARQGKKTAVIERQYIGGSCPNIACLPSKNIIHSAKVASYFWRSEEFGITKENTRINMAAVRDRKRKMVDGLIQMHLGIFEKSGAELIRGSGRFTGPQTLHVDLSDGGARTLTAHDIVISTGSRATIEPIAGLLESKPLTHIGALELDHIPGHLIILGGGYVGLEFAQAMRRFGANVTVIERNDRLIHREDPDVTSLITEFLSDEGITILTGVHVTRVEGTSGSAVTIHGTREGKPVAIHGTEILVASGRTANTDGIGLDLAGVEVTANGSVKVNEQLQTTAEHVWAVGDCAGTPHFTHMAYDDFHIVHANIAGAHRVTTGRQVPFCLFTDPEFARVGLSETEARKRSIPYLLFSVPMVSVLRTRTLSETRGFLKALVDPESGRILGVTVVGAEGGEVMGGIQVAMIAGLPFTTLRDGIFAHPTMTEALMVLFSSAPVTP